MGRRPYKRSCSSCDHSYIAWAWNGRPIRLCRLLQTVHGYDRKVRLYGGASQLCPFKQPKKVEFTTA